MHHRHLVSMVNTLAKFFMVKLSAILGDETRIEMILSVLRRPTLTGRVSPSRRVGTGVGFADVNEPLRRSADGLEQKHNPGNPYLLIGKAQYNWPS